MLPLIKATYLARACACFFGVTSNGNQQVGVTFTIVDNADHGGQTITWVGFFTEKTTARTIESLQHMGWAGDDLSELENLDAVGCERLLPNPVELVCAPETYEGDTTLRVSWVNRMGGGRFAFKDKLEGRELKTFAAQMKASIRAAKGARNGSKPDPHPNAPSSSTDDDLPF